MTATISIQEGASTRRVSKIEGVVLRGNPKTHLKAMIDRQWR